MPSAGVALAKHNLESSKERVTAQNAKSGFGQVLEPGLELGLEPGFGPGFESGLKLELVTTVHNMERNQVRNSWHFIST